MTATLATFNGYISNGTSGTAGTILTVTGGITGTITVGMAIQTSGLAITANTHILAFISGTGGAGTYTVSISQAKGTVSTPLTITGTTASVILAADYNYIQNITSSVIGTGSGTYGYGVALNATSPVTAGTQPTAVQWNNLRTDLINAYTHQGSTGSLTIPPVQAAKSSINAIDFNHYLILANSIYANALTVAASGQTSLVNLQSGSQGLYTSQWRNSVTHSITLQWSSNSLLRGFFNAGGQLRFSASLTGYLSSDPGYAKDQDWNTLLSSIGTITMNYNSLTCSGSSTSITSTAGFFNLPTGSTNIFNKTTSSPTYTPNQYDIYAYLNGSSSTATQIIISIQFQDNSTTSGHGTYGIDEYVTGSLQSTLYAYYASGSYIQTTLPTFATNTISGS